MLKIMLVFAMIAVIVLPLFGVQMYSAGSSPGSPGPIKTIPSINETANINKSQPVYFWFFGYIGNTFYPSTELNISQNSMIATAKSLGQTFGKNRVVLLTAVDEIPLPDGTINSSSIPQITSYVSQLKQYAGAVYGRLDFYQFNLTGTNYGNCSAWYHCPIYNQSRLLIDQIGLDGIWFDHPSQYNNVVGNLTFNQMMQNLTQLFSNAKFVLNQTPGAKLGYVQEMKGFTWENETYVAPSPPQKSLTVNEKQIQQLYSYYPGHILLHLDAEGPPSIGTNPYEPMSIFADLSGTQEISTLDSLVYNGTHPAQRNESYSMVVPVIGSWTCNCTAYGTSGPNYNGTLYNSLSTGTFARFTLANFEQVALEGGGKMIFSKNYISSNMGVCTLPFIAKGNELVFGVSIESTNGSSPVSIKSITDNQHVHWHQRVNVAVQDYYSNEYALASIYSAIALKSVRALTITISFSAPNGTNAQGSVGCYALVGNYTGSQAQVTSGVYDGIAPNSINATAFSPQQNSIEIAVASARSGGCKLCSVSPGIGYIANYMKPGGGQPATGMEFKYPSGTGDDCSFFLSGLQGSTVAADVCIAFTSPS